MSDANHNHICDLNEMVDIFVGDNDHGDAIPTSFDVPSCESCGVPWIKHSGIMGTCADNKSLREDLQAMLEAHDEMRLEIANLRKERDAARVEVCYAQVNGQYGRRYTPQDIAKKMGWDCFKEKEAQQAMNNIAKLDEELGL